MRHRAALTFTALIVSAAIAIAALAPQTAQPAGAAASAYRADSPEYGLSVFLYGNPNTTARDLGKLQALRFGWMKSLFQWRDLEGACKGCFSWGESDRIVSAAAAAGVKIMARLDFQPNWARPDHAHNGPPSNYQDYADFVYYFVDRYKVGSPYGTVQAIEIWNEVNLDREWGMGAINQQSASDYVRLLRLSYQAAKAADPEVTVVTAGLSPTGWNDDTARDDVLFMQWLFEAGMKGNYDALGVHANASCPQVEADPNVLPCAALPAANHSQFFFRRVEQLRAVQVANGDGDKQVWILEFGWTSDTVNPSYSWFRTTEEKKGDLIVSGFKFARQNWAPWVGAMFLWNLPDPSWTSSREEYWWSIAEPTGAPRASYTRLLQARTSGELP